jgi:hypothetical protein
MVLLSLSLSLYIYIYIYIYICVCRTRAQTQILSIISRHLIIAKTRQHIDEKSILRHVYTYIQVIHTYIKILLTYIQIIHIHKSYIQHTYIDTNHRCVHVHADMYACIYIYIYTQISTNTCHAYQQYCARIRSNRRKYPLKHYQKPLEKSWNGWQAQRKP